MLIHQLLPSIVILCLISCVPAYQIRLTYQFNATYGSDVPASYAVISESSDPPNILAYIVLYHVDAQNQTLLNMTDVLYRDEIWNRSLTGMPYPSSGSYTIRLVQSSPAQSLLAESPKFVVPDFSVTSFTLDPSSSFSTLSASASASIHSAFSNFPSSLPSSMYSYPPWIYPVASASSTYLFTVPTGFVDSENSGGGVPIAAIIGGVLGALFTLSMSLFLFLCLRRRNRFQKLKRQDSLSDKSTPMYSQHSSSSLLKPYASHDRQVPINIEPPSDPFCGGVPHPSRDGPVSAMGASASTNPAILEELNSLREKIKDLERLQQSMPEHATDSKNGSTSLFLSYQHSGTESLPQYDSVHDGHNLFPHQPHTPGSNKMQCFCSSCAV